MKKTNAVLLLGLVVIVSGWWMMTSGSNTQPQEGVVDVWSTWAQDTDQLQALFDRYSNVSGISVHVHTGVKKDRVTKAIAGSMPPDMVVLSGSGLIPSYAEHKKIEPLDSWITSTGIEMDDFYPASLAQCRTSDGTTFCLPWGCDVHALFWNKDLFQAAGLDPERPPETMEELVEYTDRLTLHDQEGKIDQIGFIPDFSRSHNDLYVRLFSGLEADDDDIKQMGTGQSIIDALNWQRQFYTKYGTQNIVTFASSLNRYMNSKHPVYAGKRLNCQQCHRDPSRSSDKFPDRGFYDEKIAMMVGGQWLAWPGYTSHSRPGLNYGVAPFPPPASHPNRVNATSIEGPVIVIPAKAKDKEAAASLLAWMISPEIMADAMLAHASLPARHEAAGDSRFLDVPDFDLFAALLANYDPTHDVTTSVSPELNEALEQIERKVLHKEQDPVLLLNDLQVRLASGDPLP